MPLPLGAGFRLRLGGRGTLWHVSVSPAGILAGPCGVELLSGAAPSWRARSWRCTRSRWNCGCQPTLRCAGPDSRVRCSLPWDAGPRWTWAAPRSTAQRTCWWPPRDYGRAIRCWRPDGGRRARRAPLMRRSPPCCIRRAPSGDGDVAGRRGTWPCCVPAAASTVGTGSGMVGRNVGARVAPRSRHPNAAPPGRAAEVLPADRRPAAAVRSPASPLRAMDQTWGWRTVP